MKACGWIERIDDGLLKIEEWLLILMTASLSLLMMSQVILRYFFSSPLFWAEQFSVQLLVFITLLGLSILIRKRMMISVDLLSRFHSAPAMKGLQTLLEWVFLVLLLFLGFYAWRWVLRPDVQMEYFATIDFPRWYTYAVMPVSILCMSWHQFAYLMTRRKEAGKESQG